MRDRRPARPPGARLHRCAMLPMRDPGAPRPGHADDLDAIPAELDAGTLTASIEGWDLSEFRSARPRRRTPTRSGPARATCSRTATTVTAATELARLSLNVAGAHTDPGATGTGRRLVYGGHTIGIAAAQAVTRALPNLVTIVAWHSCDHLAPGVRGRRAAQLGDRRAVDAARRRRRRSSTLRVQADADRVDESGSEPGARLAAGRGDGVSGRPGRPGSSRACAWSRARRSSPRRSAA